VRAPISFTYGNCVFANDLTDAWAAFAVEVSTYQWLDDDGKRARFLALLAAIEALEADLQILRVARGLDAGGYAGELEQDATLAVHGEAHKRGRRSYAAEHVQRLAALGGTTPVVFVFVSLRDPERDVASYVSRLVERGPRRPSWSE